MSAAVGIVTLAAALAAAVWGAAAALVGVRRRSALLVESARTSSYAVAGLTAIAVLAMVAALLTDDFSIAYVAERSSRATPTFFKVLALWAADEGSLLLWTAIATGYGAAVARTFRRGWPAPFPWTLAALHGVSAFFLILLLGAVRPFATLAAAPLDGAGPPPLLQNHPLMAVHPPLLYLGFLGFAAPFALTLGALATRSLSPRWLERIRTWMLASWMFLTAGLLFGAMWSYGVLGWGGYWAWDPVENLALLPWVTATGALHTMQVTRRRGRFLGWTLGLVVVTYACTLLATFLTRGSILVSVHTFADSAAGPLFLSLLTLVLLGGLGVVVTRAPDVPAPPPSHEPSLLSRDRLVLAANVVLAAMATALLLGTLYPLLAETLQGVRASVGAPYFEGQLAPLGVALLVLLGAGMAASWDRTPPGMMARRLRAPAFAAAAIAVLLFRGGRPLLLLGLAAAGFAATAVVRRMRGRASRRRVGAAAAHLGLTAAVVGIALSSGLSTSAESEIPIGGSAELAGHRVDVLDLRMLEEEHRRVYATRLEVARPSGLLLLAPSLNVYQAGPEAIASPALRLGWLRDVTATLLAFDDESVTIRLTVTPGMSLLWAGVALIVLGGGLALASSRPPPGAAAPSPKGQEREEALV